MAFEKFVTQEEEETGAKKKSKDPNKVEIKDEKGRNLEISFGEVLPQTKKMFLDLGLKKLADKLPENLDLSSEQLAKIKEIAEQREFYEIFIMPGRIKSSDLKAIISGTAKIEKKCKEECFNKEKLHGKNLGNSSTFERYWAMDAFDGTSPDSISDDDFVNIEDNVRPDRPYIVMTDHEPSISGFSLEEEAEIKNMSLNEYERYLDDKGVSGLTLGEFFIWKNLKLREEEKRIDENIEDEGVFADEGKKPFQNKFLIGSYRKTDHKIPVTRSLLVGRNRFKNEIEFKDFKDLEMQKTLLGPHKIVAIIPL